MKVSTGEAEISVRSFGVTVKLGDFPLKVADLVVPSSIIVNDEPFAMANLYPLKYRQHPQRSVRK
jgi:hypothetical protein